MHQGSNYMEDLYVDGIPPGDMINRSYFIDLFTYTTWNEFLSAGANVSGFRESRWAIAQKVKPGDYFLCYLTGLGRFVGILEVCSHAYQDFSSTIWKDEMFPVRFKVKSLVNLEPSTAVPIQLLKDTLSIFKKYDSPVAWTFAIRSSPARWSGEDGITVTNAVYEAKNNPIEREYDPKKLQYRPISLKAKIGSVTVPDPEDPQIAAESASSQGVSEPVVSVIPEETEHTEIQWSLLKLGSELGLDTWVASNDKGKSYKGFQFSQIKGLRKSLPHQFDDATQKTIELIDVLWLKSNAIVAAFEVESTTSIYSGLLRLADLIAMQPGIKIPLYLVAPSQRRNKVVSEVNRPTFSGLNPPMREMCRFISFESLRDGIVKVQQVIQYVKPEYVEELSESCEIEEA